MSDESVAVTSEASAKYDLARLSSALGVSEQAISFVPGSEVDNTRDAIKFTGFSRSEIEDLVRAVTVGDSKSSGSVVGGSFYMPCTTAERLLSALDNPQKLAAMRDAVFATTPYTWR